MPTERRLARIRSVAALRQSGLAVVLEDIHDPHNAEAVFRSCDAFGVAEAHLIFASEAPFNPRKVGKSTSSSANKWLDFHTHSSSAECLGGLRASGYRIVAAVADPSAEPLHRVDLTGQRLAILIGNEHSGLSAQARQLADLQVTVPLVGMVRSLNLSVAAAICLYEVCRQRAGAPERYRLSDEAQAKLVQDYTQR